MAKAAANKTTLVLKSFWGHLAGLPSADAVEEVFDACKRYLADHDEPLLRRMALSRPEDRARCRFTIATKGSILVVGCLGHQGEVVWEWCGAPGEFDERYGSGKGQGLGETKTCPPDIMTWVQYYNARNAAKDAKVVKPAAGQKIHLRVSEHKTICQEDVRPGNSRPTAKGVTCERCLEENEHRRRARDRSPEEWAQVAAASAQRSQGDYAYSSTDIDEVKPNALAQVADVLREKAEMNEKEKLQKSIAQLEADLAEGHRILERVQADKASSDAALGESKRHVESLEREVVELRREKEELKAEKFGLKTEVEELRKRKPTTVREVVEKPVERIVERIVEKPVAGGADVQRLRVEVEYLRDAVRQKEEEVIELRVEMRTRQATFQHGAERGGCGPIRDREVVGGRLAGRDPGANGFGVFGKFADQAPSSAAVASGPMLALADDDLLSPEVRAAILFSAGRIDAKKAGEQIEGFASAYDRIVGCGGTKPATPARPIAPGLAQAAEESGPPAPEPPVPHRPASNGDAAHDANPDPDGRKATPKAWHNRPPNDSEKKVHAALLGGKGKWISRDDLAKAVGCKPVSIAPLVSIVRKLMKCDIQSSKGATDAPGYTAYRLVGSAS